MNRRDFLKKTALVGVSAALGGCLGPVEWKKDSKPNVLFILVDDLGAKDLGCYGSSFYETPNIDALAAAGMMFTNAYAASPVCTPTRASIQSGKYPARIGINFILNDGLKDPSYPLCPPHCETEMKLSEVTLAETLKTDGYKTFFAGKWHLGEEEKYYPEQQGYDINYGGHKGGQPGSYFYPYENDFMDGYFNVPDLEDGEEGKYLTDHLTDKTVEFIKNNSDNSFFAFMSYYSVHTPLEAKPDLVEKYRLKAEKMGLGGEVPFEVEENACDDYRTPEFEKISYTRTNQAHAVYAAMIESVDQNVGRLLRCLEQEGLADNTAVILFSDNGGLSTHTHRPLEKMPTSNYPLRAGKGWLYEGGIREPLIVRWPGVVKPGSYNDEPVISVDFYPTVMDMAGIKSTPQKLDGVSLMPLLTGRKELDRDAIYWHMPHYHSSGVCPSGAVRWKDYKLIEYFEDSRVELFNLKDDESERNDISGKRPDIAALLKTKLENWRKDVNAAMPVKQ
ncbi:MAG: sulfatase-like hydrolase/transferase [Sedimentisphaeraceae bacterium JB056]